jgi:PAS domain S-box-containing protein
MSGRGKSAREKARCDENARLRARLEEAEETLRAIRSGEVDALVIGEQVYSLAGAETPYRRLIEAMDEGAATLTEDGTVFYANRRLAEMLGAPLQEVIGMKLRDFVVEGDRAACDALLGEGRSRPATTELILRGRGGAGGIPAQLSAGALEAHGMWALWVVAADLTERRAALESIRRLNAGLEQRVRERTAALEEANGEMEAFVYSVSHDLRAPLRVMDGFGRILEEECAGHLGEAGMDSLRRVREASRRMARLIDDLLRLSGLGRAAMRREPVDMGALARELETEFRRHEPQRRVVFTVGEDMRAEADPGLIRAVLENLLGNAWKFTGREPEARIEFGREERDGETVFFVRDNGVGFDMAYAGKLFGPFQRLHARENFPGTGVGLASVQRIIRRHGGRVWVDSAPGRGATFYFTLGKGGG